MLGCWEWDKHYRSRRILQGFEPEKTHVSCLSGVFMTAHQQQYNFSLLYYPKNITIISPDHDDQLWLALDVESHGHPWETVKSLFTHRWLLEIKAKDWQNLTVMATDKITLQLWISNEFFTLVVEPFP